MNERTTEMLTDFHRRGGFEFVFTKRTRVRLEDLMCIYVSK